MTVFENKESVDSEQGENIEDNGESKKGDSQQESALQPRKTRYINMLVSTMISTK